MPPIDICICAEGTLPVDEARELEDLGLRSHVDHVVLGGTLTDQAALMGVLERLHRAGLAIRDVAPTSSHPQGDHIVQLAIVGQVGALIQAVLGDAVVTEEPATTRAEVSLADPEALFEVLHRLESLGLDLHEVHVDRPNGAGTARHHRHLL